MEVREGYKQTEVGVVPEDWYVVSMGSLGAFSKGMGIKKDEAQSGNIPCVRYGEIYTHHNDIVREFNSWISPEVAKTSRRLKKGELLFAGSGETKEEIGKCVAFISEEEAYAGSDVVILTPNKGISKFFGYLFNAPIITKQKANKGQGDAIVHISATALSSIRIPLPTLAEQEAIAEALSDSDALIESLETLLAKKRQVKQGAMSELLTGKRRLVKSGKWEEKKLSDICWYQEGPGVRTWQFTKSGIKLLNGTNIFSGEINLDNTDRFISENLAYGQYAHFMADSGDIVIASSGITVEKFEEKVAFVRDEHLPLCMNTSTIRFKANKNVLQSSFLYFLLMSNMFKKKIGHQATGSAQLNFGPAHLNKVLFKLPDLPEQTAIAEILSDMDTEIRTLEEKLSKARQVKQGMMSELLTGKIRLNHDEKD